MYRVFKHYTIHMLSKIAPEKLFNATINSLTPSLKLLNMNILIQNAEII